MTTTPKTRAGRFFRAAYGAYVAARQREADQYVAGVLLMLDDETLRAHGYSREELSKRRNALPL